jgi:hypothetical protein
MVRLKIELPGENRSYYVWVDPGFNWLIRKCIHKMTDADGAALWDNEYEVTQFQEVKHSLFVPIKSEAVLRFKGKRVAVTRATISDVAVNERISLPPMPKLTAGMPVLDEIKGLAYRADKSGRAVGPPTRLGTMYSPPIDGPPSGGGQETRSTLGWVAVGVAVLLGGVGVVRLVVRSRRASGSTA